MPWHRPGPAPEAGKVKNAGPLVLALVGVMMWYTFATIRQAARDFTADDRYDVFEEDE